MKINIEIDLEEREWIVKSLGENELFISKSIKDCYNFAKENNHTVCNVDNLYLVKASSPNVFFMCKSKIVTRFVDIGENQKDKQIVKTIRYPNSKVHSIFALQRYLMIYYKCKIDIVKSFNKK